MLNQDAHNWQAPKKHVRLLFAHIDIFNESSLELDCWVWQVSSYDGNKMVYFDYIIIRNLFSCYFGNFNYWVEFWENIQYFYWIYPTSVTVPYRTALYCMWSYLKKNTIVRLFVTFTVTFYPVTRTVTSIVTLNCNGKYTVTVIIVTAR